MESAKKAADAEKKAPASGDDAAAEPEKAKKEKPAAAPAPAAAAPAPAPAAKEEKKPKAPKKAAAPAPAPAEEEPEKPKPKAEPKIMPIKVPKKAEKAADSDSDSEDDEAGKSKLLGVKLEEKPAVEEAGGSFKPMEPPFTQKVGNKTVTVERSPCSEAAKPPIVTPKIENGELKLKVDPPGLPNKKITRHSVDMGTGVLTTSEEEVDRDEAIAESKAEEGK